MAEEIISTNELQGAFTKKAIKTYRGRGLRRL
jgi:hypothetical protein